MRRKKIAILMVIMLGLGLGGCQEVYFPDLEKVEPILVVEGLVSNQPGPYRVKLSLAGRFQEPPVFNGVSGATVSIRVSDGNIVSLHEFSPGNYYTPIDFAGEVGKHYTLHISTPDGNQYKSTAQEILPPMSIDSIYGVKSEKVFYKPSSVSNSLFPFNVTGTYAFISTSGSIANIRRFRYTSSMYVQYGVLISDIAVDNCWIKKSITNFQSSDLGVFSNLDGASQEIGFAPLFANGLHFLGYPANLLYDQVRVMINRIYTLNPESYSFHKAKNDQLNTEGRIFDPISAQLPGNISCINDPERVALGFFEASSETIHTYRIVTNILQGTVNIIHLPSMENIPLEGCLRNDYPPFWVN
jgi:hypothetical protein